MDLLSYWLAAVVALALRSTTPCDGCSGGLSGGCSNEKFWIKFGTNTRSSRTVIASVQFASKFQCATACDELRLCGGFNVRKLSGSSGIPTYSCELIHGMSEAADMIVHSGVNYYELTQVTLNGCEEYRDFNAPRSRIDVTIRIDGIYQTVSVNCDQDTDGGGWTVLTRRYDGSEDFNRSWSDYKSGFGSLDGEFYIGNDFMHALTSSSQTYEVRVDMTRYNGETAHASFASFSVGPESDNYRLSVGAYTGGIAGGSMAELDGVPFSTPDVDNDQWALSCGEHTRSGFWFASCSPFTATGVWGEVVPYHYIPSIHTNFHPGLYYKSWLDMEHPQAVSMKVRPV